MIDYPQGVEVEIPGIPEDTKYLGDRLDRIAGDIAALKEATLRRESPAPGLLVMLTAAAPRHVWSVRMRLTHLVITDLQNGVIRLGIGTINYPFAVANNCQVVPFPTTVEAGVDVSIAAPSLLTGDGAVYVLGYPDE